MLALLSFLNLEAHAKTINTNETKIENAPSWLNATQVEKVTARIQNKLEWTTRKIQVTWYSDAESFGKAQSLGPQAIAVTRITNGQAAVLMGPKVNQTNFASVFGHELVHVIIAQKYKTSIPKWLEEGLANHLSKVEKVNYQWLANQPFPQDVRELAHPFSGSTDGISYRYKASQAFAEMLDKKCDLDNLIRLSVERKLEDYIKRTCEIKDLNQAFQDWVKKKARS